MIHFEQWSGPDGIEQYIINQTGCKPFSGAGICPRPNKKTTILRSVDNTYYYDDDFSDIHNIKYTLFGHNGDQDATEKKFNEPLLNQHKTQNVYVYRVTEKGYIWYGKYKIVEQNTTPHIGKNRMPRNIIVLSLQKIP
jgi:hypothetical protein